MGVMTGVTVGQLTGVIAGLMTGVTAELLIGITVGLLTGVMARLLTAGLLTPVVITCGVDIKVTIASNIGFSTLAIPLATIIFISDLISANSFSM